MIKKEWLEVGKQSLSFTLLMAGMGLLVFLQNLLQDKPFEGDMVAIGLGLGLLMFSMILGLSPFALDSKQKGMEYLLTLPFSRRRLLFIKLLPRLAAVVLFYGVLFALYHLMGSDGFSGYFAFFSLSYFALFFISFSFSIFHENFIVQSILAGLALGGYMTLCSLILTLGFAWSNNFSLSSVWRFAHFGDIIYDSSSLIAALIVFLLMLAPFIISHFLAFKRFDLRLTRAFNRRQLLFFVPLLLMALIASLGVSYLVQKNFMFVDANFYLTENGQLLKASWPGKLVIYDENGRKQIDTGKALYWNRVLLEKGQQIFLLGYDTEDGSYIINSLNMKDFSWKTLHRVPDHYLAGNSFFSFSYDGAGFVYLQRSRVETDRPGMQPGLSIKGDKLELVSLDPFSGQSRTIIYRSQLFKKYYEPQFFGCDKINGLRFWLISHRWSSVLRLWEDGRVEDLGFSKGLPAYYGNLLFTIGDGSLHVRQLLDVGSRTIKDIVGEFKLVPNFNFFQANNQVGEMYAKRGERIVCLDLTTLAVDDVGPARGLIRLVLPGDFYYIEHEGWPHRAQAQPDRWRRVYRLQNGKAVFLKQFDFNDAGYGHIFVGKFGIIMYQRKDEKTRNRFFAFPDLRELKFNKLN